MTASCVLLGVEHNAAVGHERYRAITRAVSATGKDAVLLGAIVLGVERGRLRAFGRLGYATS
ncbi:hypothetical protein SAMN05446635_6181 [Burkholderia sp. OK233]|nr:hypothetical protein SAMN05446635_6181 [Burkholderia sp. OK233]